MSLSLPRGTFQLVVRKEESGSRRDAQGWGWHLLTRRSTGLEEQTSLGRGRKSQILNLMSLCAGISVSSSSTGEILILPSRQSRPAGSPFFCCIWGNKHVCLSTWIFTRGCFLLCMLRQVSELGGKKRNLNMEKNSTKGQKDKSEEQTFHSCSFFVFFLLLLLLLKYSFLKANSTTVMALMWKTSLRRLTVLTHATNGFDGSTILTIWDR